MRLDRSQTRRGQRGNAWIDAGGQAPRSTATVTVTIRMPVVMVESLKTEAQHQGVRGYQTLLRLWIEERLDGERLVAARHLRPILRRLQDAEGELRRLMAETNDDR